MKNKIKLVVGIPSFLLSFVLLEISFVERYLKEEALLTIGGAIFLHLIIGVLIGLISASAAGELYDPTKLTNDDDYNHFGNY